MDKQKMYKMWLDELQEALTRFAARLGVSASVSGEEYPGAVETYEVVRIGLNEVTFKVDLALLMVAKVIQTLGDKATPELIQAETDKMFPPSDFNERVNELMALYRLGEEKP